MVVVVVVVVVVVILIVEVIGTVVEIAAVELSSSEVPPVLGVQINVDGTRDPATQAKLALLAV